MKYFTEKHNLKVGTKDSAGIDLPACLNNTIIVFSKSYVDIDTKIHVEIPQGCFGMVVPRSSIGTKKHLALQNTVGIIDSDYRGSIKLKFFNYGNNGITIEDGEYVAQMIIVPYTSVDLQKVDTLNELSETERGAGGFGSTNNPQIKNYNNYTFEGKELKKGLKEFLLKDVLSNNQWKMVADTKNMDIKIFSKSTIAFNENQICIWENKERALSQFDEWWHTDYLEKFATKQEIREARLQSSYDSNKVDCDKYRINLFNILKDNQEFKEAFDKWLSFDMFFEQFAYKFNKALK